MPVLRPFQAIRYNLDTVKLDEVVAPPYDVISPEQQDRLYAKHPNNVVRLILGREADRYASAAAAFSAWRQERILIRDERPAIYCLHQTFSGPGGKAVTRKGFIGLCRLEEFDKKVVLPHEKTLAKPREDRFKLFTATSSNFSQVFSLYWDSEKRVDSVLNGFAAHPPLMDVEYEEVRNRVWRIDDPSSLKQVVDIMAGKQVLIADGHHRYETALAYRDLRRSQNPNHTGNELYNYVMMFFSNIEDEGLVIYPTHRIVHSLQQFDRVAFMKKLSDRFVVREVANARTLQTGLESATTRSFGVVLAGDPKLYLISLKPSLAAADCVPDDLPNEVKELDVTLLHTVILRDILGISAEAQEKKLNLDYVRQAQDALDAASRGKAQVAFVLNATKLEEVRTVARGGNVMPQKSTYFFPKLLSGLVFNLMDA